MSLSESNSFEEELNVKLKEELKEEIIVLNHLQNMTNNDSEYYLPSPYELDEKSKEYEIERKNLIESFKRVKPGANGLRKLKNIPPYTYIKSIEKEKDNIKKVELFKKNCLNNYYKIESEKIHELEKIFSQSKLKVYLNNLNILSEDKIYSIYSKKEFIYKQSKLKIQIFDKIKFILLNEIELECDNDSHNNIKVIELDNKDLIIHYNKNDTSNINIYKYKDNTYVLFQTIKEYYSSKLCGDIIKKLSGNRFMFISSNQIKIYSLNENNIYDNILSDPNQKFKESNDEKNEKDIEKDDNIEIKDIDDNEDNSVHNEDNSVHNEDNSVHNDFDINYGEEIKDINIYKVDLNNFIFCILKTLENYYDDEGDEFCKNIYEPTLHIEYYYEIKRVAFNNSKLIKNSSIYCKEIKNKSNPKECIILKNKYFLIIIEGILHIYNINDMEELKRFKFLEVKEDKTNLVVIKNYDIYKWNCSDDNEFILNIEGNITLFKLYEEEKEKIGIKIITFSFFKRAKNLRKIDEKNNRFYRQFDKYILIF